MCTTENLFLALILKSFFLTIIWMNIHLWVKVEESSEDEAAGELAKRGLGKLGSVENNRSESDLSGPLSLVSSLLYTCKLYTKLVFAPGQQLQ